MYTTSRENKSAHFTNSAQGLNGSHFFQPKIIVNQPSDEHERQADDVADQVMRMREGGAPIVQRTPLIPVLSPFGGGSGEVARKCAACDEKEKEGVQRKETGEGDTSGKSAPSVVSDVLSSRAGKPMEGSGRQLLAHKLVHLGQQKNDISRKIQRQDEQRKSIIPFVEKGNSKVNVKIETLISIIEEFEKLFPEVVGDTKKEITLLRKLYYGQAGWDTYLIPNAKNVNPAFPTVLKETPRKFSSDVYGEKQLIDKTDSVSASSTKGLEITAEKVAVGKKLKSAQEVIIPDGTLIDIGHVLAGLDAVNYPSAVDAGSGVPWYVPGDYNKILRIESNVGAVTWIGDLASVLAEALIKQLEKPPLESKEWADTVKKYAPPKDMFGNIDAYVISSKKSQKALSYDISLSKNGKTFSKILKDFYLGTNNTIKLKRFTVFASEIGALNNDGKISASKYRKDIVTAAALYLGSINAPKDMVIDVGLPELSSAMLDGSSDNDLKKKHKKVAILTNYYSFALIAEFETELQQRVDAEK